MKKIMVLLNFIRLRLGLKILFYKNVITEMTGNPLFTEPDVLMADLTTALNKFETSYNASRGGSHESILIMHRDMAAADELFRKTAMYVDRIANGDEIIIVSAGFEASNQPYSSMRPIFSVKNGPIPGQVILRCKAVKNAQSYTWQHAAGAIPADEEDWVFAGTSTKVTFTINNLTSLTKYWFRFCAVRSDGMTAWSAPIMIIVI